MHKTTDVIGSLFYFGNIVIAAFLFADLLLVLMKGIMIFSPNDL